MPNLRTQDVHTYITELLLEVMGTKETEDPFSQSDRPAVPAGKHKPSVTDSHRCQEPVHPAKIGG